MFGEHSHSEEYRALNPQLLPLIEILAAAMADRFKTAQREREKILINAGVEPETF